VHHDYSNYRIIHSNARTAKYTHSTYAVLLSDYEIRVAQSTIIPNKILPQLVAYAVTWTIQMKISKFRTLAKSELSIEWIVKGLISAGSFTYLVGPAGSGKSMLCVQLCNAIQQGKKFLGMQTTQHNCLYLQADAGSMEWKYQVESLAPESEAWTVYELNRGFLDKPEDVEQIRKLVWGDYDETSPYYPALRRQKFTFIIIDCLTAVTSQDLNTKTATEHILKNIERIVTRKVQAPNGEASIERIHFVLIHHPQSGPTRGTLAGSGSKVWGALCGTMFTLANNILILEKSKVLDKAEYMLERESNGAWVLADTEEFSFNDALKVPF
jgi:archaellum biogenesis ATPase FlaH